MGLCWEEPSPDLCNTFAGRPWPVTLAGDRGQPRASSTAGEPGTGPGPAAAQAGAHSPYISFCLFLTIARICLQALRLIFQLRSKQCHLINREFFNNQMGFKTLIQPNNSKICHKLQHSNSQLHPKDLAFTLKFWKTTTKRPKSEREGVKTVEN